MPALVGFGRKIKQVGTKNTNATIDPAGTFKKHDPIF